MILWMHFKYISTSSAVVGYLLRVQSVKTELHEVQENQNSSKNSTLPEIDCHMYISSAFFSSSGNFLFSLCRSVLFLICWLPLIFHICAQRCNHTHFLISSTKESELMCLVWFWHLQNVPVEQINNNTFNFRMWNKRAHKKDRRFQWTLKRTTAATIKYWFTLRTIPINHTCLVWSTRVYKKMY